MELAVFVVVVVDVIVPLVKIQRIFVVVIKQTLTKYTIQICTAFHKLDRFQQQDL